MPSLGVHVRLVILTVSLIISLLVIPAKSATTPVCNKFGVISVSKGRYIVQNNVWNDSITQCIDVTNTGFSIVSGYHSLPSSGAPAAYPSIYSGCHFGRCSSNSGLPLQVSTLGNVRSSATYSTPSNGQWDAAYDMWFDSSPHPAGQNNGAEIMIWGDHSCAPHPFGTKIGVVQLAGATWGVWEGLRTENGVSWNLVSYVRAQTTNSLEDLSLTEFTNDAARRGYVQRSWYLTSVQFGFEPWQGGPGLTVRSFSFTTHGE